MSLNKVTLRSGGQEPSSKHFMKFCPACSSKFDDNVSFCPKDGEVLEEDPHSFVGSVLDGQYQIEALLGRGGMGAVYRARHILLGDRVAIKMLPPEMRSNTEWLRRFQREGQAARRFRHPNAVTVYDLRTSSDGTIYLVMEYVEGMTLDAELKKRGRFSPADALATLRPIISVLDAAHAMGVVHRDLKPENIMIGKPTTGGEPTVKLLDLGIAKLREVAGAEKTGNTNLTVAGQMLGTPYYMSPEQWGELPHDGSSEIDGRADIYSLGILIYEMILGRRPFTGVTILELRKQHVNDKPKPLQDVAPDVPIDFGNAIARALAKDRSGRQTTAGQLERELESALSSAVAVSAPIPATIVGPAPPEIRFVTEANRRTPTVEDLTAMTILDGGADPAASSQAATTPTVVVSAEELSARAAARAREVPQPFAQPKLAAPLPKKGFPLLLVGVIAVVLLFVIAAAGYALMQYRATRATGVATATAPASRSDLAAPLHEVARYWLEVDAKGSAEVQRAGDTVTMQSGQSFKFHFSPNEGGYLYLIGPGPNNAPAIFLSAKPSGSSGLKTNEVRSGVDFSFPSDMNNKANFITLDQSAGTDEFTFVFSRARLENPPFFAGTSNRLLTPDEVQAWNDFQKQAKASEATIEVVAGGQAPQAAVKVPQNAPENASVVFRVRIEHK
jgi:serine/threonine protein kinase